ncbi:hypothetical protein ADUPG1_000365, partial [Aduncisulcus paluster]
MEKMQRKKEHEHKEQGGDAGEDREVEERKKKEAEEAKRRAEEERKRKIEEENQKIRREEEEAARNEEARQEEEQRRERERMEMEEQQEREEREEREKERREKERREREKREREMEEREERESIRSQKQSFMYDEKEKPQEKHAPMMVSHEGFDQDQIKMPSVDPRLAEEERKAMELRSIRQTRPKTARRAPPSRMRTRMQQQKQMEEETAQVADKAPIAEDDDGRCRVLEAQKLDETEDLSHPSHAQSIGQLLQRAAGGVTPFGHALLSVREDSESMIHEHKQWKEESERLKAELSKVRAAQEDRIRLLEAELREVDTLIDEKERNLPSTSQYFPRKQMLISDPVSLPDDFDSRKVWPWCEMIGEIRDQESCGSCWAFGSSESFGDRFCIATEGDKLSDEFLAPQWLISCDKTDNACDGGNPGRAGYYFMSHGTTTDDCFPYVSGDGEFIPDCPSTCDDGSTPELYYASDVIRLEGEEQMMDSIHANGPIVVGFVVYEDFEAYTS